MDDARWQELKALFFEALDRPEGQRAAWLAQIDDPALREELERLLAGDEAASPVLDTPPEALAALVENGADVEPVAKQIGPYRLLSTLGRGGMGTVYLAERADGAFRQRVALKVIRRGIDTEDVVRRFEQERQILAALNHPHIARLLDGGTTEAGLPYFVMECIDGVPITAYCDRHRLPVAARLRLFEQACAAVHYAHQNLIIHRDLKPSNMLVTEDSGSGPGQARLKLLDFGIAKLLAPDEPDLLQTRTGARVLTPAYASPEQRAGQPLSTASDVYALGVVLYELLTGQRPFATPPDQDAASSLQTPQPPRPSTAVTSAADTEARAEARATTAERLRRRLAGDLDTIVLKALREKPERRYASAEAFLDDVQRHLDGLPVRAQNDTFGYRTVTFARRHRTSVVAALLIAALLVGGGLFHTVQVSRERDLARQEAEKAEQVTLFLTDLLQRSNPNYAPGGSATVREVLDEGTERLQKELLLQPALRAHLLETIGEIYYGLGLYDEAGRQAEAVLAAQRQLHGSRHRAVADALRQLAKVRQAQARVDEAVALSREALALHRALLGENHPDVARSLERVAMAVRWHDEPEEAEALLRRCVAIYRRHTAFQAELAQALTSLAHIVRGQQRAAEAEALHREAFTLQRQIWGAEHPYAADALINLAGVALDQQHYEAAERYFLDGLAMRRRTQGEDHPEIGVDLGGLARLYRETGDLAAAERTHREAVAHLRRTLAPEHEETIVNLYALSGLLMAQGRAAEAEPLLRAALAGRQATHPAGHWLIAEAESLLGACLTAQGRFIEAEPLLQNAYETLRRQRGDDDAYTQEAHHHLITLQQHRPR